MHKTIHSDSVTENSARENSARERSESPDHDDECSSDRNRDAQNKASSEGKKANKPQLTRTSSVGPLPSFDADARTCVAASAL